MKIQSRPKIKQSCEPIVEQALRQMQQGSYFTPTGVAHGSGTSPMGNCISLDQHERTLGMIMKTLLMSGVLTHYEIGATRETKNSTYENTEWMIRIKFTDDPTKKTGYVADLLFNYTH